MFKFRLQIQYLVIMAKFQIMAIFPTLTHHMLQITNDIILNSYLNFFLNI